MGFSDSEPEEVGVGSEAGSTPACTKSTPKASKPSPDCESSSSGNVSSLSTASKETPASNSKGGKRKPSEILQNPSKKPTKSTPNDRKDGDFTSEVWAYFRRNVVKGKEDDGLRAICKFCGADYQISGTGNLRNHLKNKHSEELPESMLKEKMKQTTLENNLTVAKPFKVKYIIIFKKFNL